MLLSSLAPASRKMRMLITKRMIDAQEHALQVMAEAEI